MQYGRGFREAPGWLTCFVPGIPGICRSYDKLGKNRFPQK